MDFKKLDKLASWIFYLWCFLLYLVIRTGVNADESLQQLWKIDQLRIFVLITFLLSFIWLPYTMLRMLIIFIKPKILFEKGFVHPLFRVFDLKRTIYLIVCIAIVELLILIFA